MKKYQVFIPMYAEVRVIVEAEDKEQAVDKAFKNMTRTVCCHCSRHVELGEFRDDETPHVEVFELAKKALIEIDELARPKRITRYEFNKPPRFYGDIARDALAKIDKIMGKK